MNLRDFFVYLVFVVILVLANYSHAFGVSGILKGQAAYGLESNDFQQQEWQLDIEINDSLLGGDVTAIARLRWDWVDDLNPQDSSRPDNYSSIGGPLAVGESGAVGLRELYWEKSVDDVYWKLGKQQVVWGEADGIKLLDVINPQSFREFILDDFDDSRIPLWMINAEVNIGDNDVLQLLWVPDTTAHELAPSQSPFAFTSNTLVPQPNPNLNLVINDVEAPQSVIRDSDFGTRYTTFITGWDFSINYLYHYVDSPVVRARISGENIIVDQQYERSHLLGGTASTAFGDWILRTELAYETDRYQRTRSAIPGVAKSDQLSSVIGVDWQGWTDQFVSLQWFQTTIVNSSNNLINDRREDSVTFMWESKFFNETLTLEWLHIHSLNNNDGVVQSKLTYNYEANLDIYVGADVFYGDDNEMFGQFDQNDRILFGFEVGF